MLGFGCSRHVLRLTRNDILTSMGGENYTDDGGELLVPRHVYYNYLIQTDINPMVKARPARCPV